MDVNQPMEIEYSMSIWDEELRNRNSISRALRQFKDVESVIDLMYYLNSGEWVAVHAAVTPGGHTKFIIGKAK